MELTNKKVNALRDEIQKVLDAHGFEDVEFQVKGAKYSQTEVDFKLNAKVKGALSDGQNNMICAAAAWGMDMEKIATLHGRQFKLESFDRRARKYKVLARCLGNKELYKFTVEQAKEMFAAK